MDLLKFKDLKKRYGKYDVLKGVNFSIKENEIFGLIGSSGSGKSTILKILTGMTKADSGEILFENKSSLQDKTYLQQNIGFATQENMLFDELTIKENGFYFGNLYGLKRKNITERFKELLFLLKLEGFEDTPINHLSGGMMKRANLLVSLIHAPKLLILDEPTVGLDTLLRDSLWEYIHKINKNNTTILVTSHLLEEMEINCQRIAILKKGKIISLASPEEYKYNYKKKSFNEIFNLLINDKDN